MNDILPADADLCVVDPPDDDPFFGENHALWLWDHSNGIGFHTYLKTLQHLGKFGLRRETINVHLPDAVSLMAEQDGPGPTDRQVARGSNLACKCVDPFQAWRFTYDATAQPSSANEMRSGLLRHLPLTPLAFDLTVTAFAPPWLLGTFSAGDQTEWARSYFGSSRYEQLVSATGSLRTADEEYSINALGMRTHRVGTRSTGTFPGHSWLTAAFPSGRAFGVQRFCRADGVPLWQEAFVQDADGTRHAATPAAMPLVSLQLPGEPLELELISDRGSAVISGTMMAKNFVSCMSADPQRFCWGLDGSEPTNRIMCQGLAEYEWDGERGGGMIERSARVDDLASLLDAPE
jgi:hypothetical protein